MPNPKESNPPKKRVTAKPKPATKGAKPVASAPKKTAKPKVKEGAPAPKKINAARSGRFKYEVCFSFAGENRRYVDQVAKHLKALDPSFRFFYDYNEGTELWGEDLPVRFNQIYEFESRFCVMFISSFYAEKEWTTLERRFALSRMLREKGKAYILPAYFDETSLLGVPRSMGHVDLKQTTPLQLAQKIIRKIKPGVSPSAAPEKTPKPRATRSVPPTSGTTDAQSHRGQIAGSGTWMMLNGEFYKTKLVTDKGDRIEVKLVPNDADQRARLVDLDPKRGSHFRPPVAFAYGEDAARVNVESVEKTSATSKPEFALVLRRTPSNAHVPWSDDAAKDIVKRLLLTDANIGATHHSGFYSASAKPNVLQKAWSKRDPVLPLGDSLRCARLEAICELKTSGGIEHVLELKLGPIKNGVLSVEFRGRRSNAGMGGTTSAFSLSGSCDLTDA